MGWFWTSSSTPTADAPSAAAPPAPANPPPVSGDREIQKFWQMIQEEGNTNTNGDPSAPASAPPPSPPSATPKQPSQPSTLSSWLPWARDPVPEKPKPAPEQQPSRLARSAASIAMSEAQLPTTMSCRDAFDYAYHCQNPASQLNSVYRDGGLRSCSELWDDFWFCMRTKNLGPEAKAEAIKAHFRAKEEEKYGGGKPSSEDVWESREELVPPGTAFRAPFAPPRAEREEGLEKLDLERRREEREEMWKREGKR